MDRLTLLDRARAAQMEVSARDGQLIVRGPAEHAELAKRLIADKRHVLRELEERQQLARAEDQGVAEFTRQLPLFELERWSERAAMREFHGGMTRTKAERAALIDIRPEAAGLIGSASLLADAFDGSIITYAEGKSDASQPKGL